MLYFFIGKYSTFSCREALPDEGQLHNSSRARLGTSRSQRMSSDVALSAPPRLEHGGVGQAVVSSRHKLQAIESVLSVTRPSGSRSPKSSGHRRRQEQLSPSRSLCPSQMENEIATRLANRETQQQRYFRKLIVQRMDSSKRKLQGRLIRKLVISVYTPGLCVMKEEVCISRCRHLLSMHSFVNKTKVCGASCVPRHMHVGG